MRSAVGLSPHTDVCSGLPQGQGRLLPAGPRLRRARAEASGGGGTAGEEDRARGRWGPALPGRHGRGAGKLSSRQALVPSEVSPVVR